MGGDDWFTPSGYLLAELARRGQLRSWVDHARRAVPTGLCRDTRSAVLSLTMRPLLEPHLRGPFRRRDAGNRQAQRWVAPELVRRVGLDERLATRGLDLPATQRWRWWSIHGGETSVGLARLARRTARYGYEFRHPFLDLRVAEFGLRLPERLRWRGVESPWIQREAMVGRLPEAVRTRRTKAGFTLLAREQLAAVGGRSAFQDLELAARGWVDEAAALADYDAVAPADGPPIDATDSLDGVVERLWGLFALERWARANRPS